MIPAPLTQIQLPFGQRYSGSPTERWFTQMRDIVASIDFSMWPSLYAEEWSEGMRPDNLMYWSLGMLYNRPAIYDIVDRDVDDILAAGISLGKRGITTRSGFLLDNPRMDRA